MNQVPSDRRLRYFENIDVLIVFNEARQAVGIYSAKSLACFWLEKGEQVFAERYGFPWTPPDRLKSTVKERSQKGAGRR